MKYIAPLVAVALLGLSVLNRVWWLKPLPWTPPRLSVVAALLLFGAVFYFGFVYARSRSPMLWIGPLVPDFKVGYRDCIFHLEVKSLGPGTIQPVVKIVSLRDGKGRPLPMKAAFEGSEAHWRYGAPGVRPNLAEGESAFAGILLVQEPQSESPFLGIYPLDQKPIALPGTGIPLTEQTEIRLQITASYLPPEGLEAQRILVVRRTYTIKPDRTEPLAYKAKRVKRWLSLQ